MVKTNRLTNSVKYTFKCTFLKNIFQFADIYVFRTIYKHDYFYFNLPMSIYKKQNTSNTKTFQCMIKVIRSRKEYVISILYVQNPRDDTSL